MGTLHVVTGADHISAVASLAVGNSPSRAFALGARWGAGHSVGLLFVFVVLLALRLETDEAFMRVASRWMGLCVGAFMVALGVYGVREVDQRLRDAERDGAGRMGGMKNALGCSRRRKRRGGARRRREASHAEREKQNRGFLVPHRLARGPRRRGTRRRRPGRDPGRPPGDGAARRAAGARVLLRIRRRHRRRHGRLRRRLGRGDARARQERWRARRGVWRCAHPCSAWWSGSRGPRFP